MKLKKFIKKLQEISEKYGDNAEVIMADCIPVVEPFFLSDENIGDSVIITDQR